MQRRDRIDIIYDMLRTIQVQQGKIRPTRLMYKANMAHGQMQGYLNELEEKGFIRKQAEKGHEFLILTESGYRFIVKIKEMKEFGSMFGI